MYIACGGLLYESAILPAGFSWMCKQQAGPTAGDHEQRSHVLIAFGVDLSCLFFSHSHTDI